MAQYTIKLSSRFKSDYKKIKNNKRFVIEFEKVVGRLEHWEKLDKKYKDHELKGKLASLRECHVFPDILLVYSISDENLVLCLLRVGSHSEIF
jgi:mRNA interferase YafQ